MHAVLATSLLVFITLVSAIRLRGDGHREVSQNWPRCPDVWRYIGEELKYWFIDDEGYCSDLAAQAIRLPFHDCFPGGGCDGSVILTDECTTRPENLQLIPICGVLYKISLDYRVSAADLINFAACKCRICLTADERPSDTLLTSLSRGKQSLPLGTVHPVLHRKEGQRSRVYARPNPPSNPRCPDSSETLSGQKLQCHRSCGSGRCP